MLEASNCTEIFPSSPLSVFEPKVIEKLFHSILGWDDGSFCVFKVVHSDGSSTLWLDYPTDMNKTEAIMVMASVQGALRTMTLDDIIKQHLQD